MKPFDLQKVLAGEPVVTRDGRPVTHIVHYSTNNGEFIVGLLGGDLSLWSDNGKYYPNGQFSNSDNDLFMAENEKVRKEGYVIIWPSKEYWVTTRIFDTYGEADMFKDKYVYVRDRLVVAKINWYE